MKKLAPFKLKTPPILNQTFSSAFQFIEGEGQGFKYQVYVTNGSEYIAI